MARIRTIKPEFPQSESMGRVSREARLLFIQLFTLCDDEGRTRASSRMLASLLYPYDDGEDGHEKTTASDVERWLCELDREGCAVRYTIEGTTYLQVCNWLNHQKIDKPSPSKIAPFDGVSRIVAKPREESSEEVDQGPKDQGGDQGGDQESNDWPLASQTKRPKKLRNEYPEEFDAIFAAYPRKGDTDKSGAFKAWSARLKEGVSPDVIAEGVARYAAYCTANCTENNFIKQPKTFFGPDRHFLNEWRISVSAVTQSPQDQRRQAIAKSLGMTGAPQRPERVIDGECHAETS